MQKIAILGGGIGSLATAAELTNDPNWQKNYEITIYQMGWRLGGKGASGRNQKIHDRIQEHGIHLWMGFYENAFGLIRQIYAEAHTKVLMPTSPFTDARKAFTPMNYTPMMEQVGKDWKLWPLNWPPSNEFPGDPERFDQCEQPPTPLGFLNIILNRAIDFLDGHKDKHPILTKLYKDAATHLSDAVGYVPHLPSGAEPARDHSLLHRAEAFAKLLSEDAKRDAHLELVKWIKGFNEMFAKAVYGLIEKDDELRRFFIIIDTAMATLVGMIEDNVLQKGFLAIEDYDMIEWLKKHGCVEPDSAITLGMYDACFGYENGDPKKRRMAAGSTLYGALRLMFTYRGALMWWMNAGMGETIMSPIYLVLKSRGVKFKFFHKVSALHLSADKKEIDSIDLEVQATIKNDKPDNEYDPLFLGVDGVPVWPTEPLWEQVVEAEKIQKCVNPDLESWWTDWHGTASSLKRGTDFDLVLLGISLGAHKYICEELIAASSKWRDSVDHVGVVRTQGLQLWMNKSMAESGWEHPRGILSGFVEPFDTWSDMSDLIAREKWSAAQKVQQVAYFCNAYPDDEEAPFSDPTYPAKERAKVMQFSRQFLDGPALDIFTKSADPITPGKFNDDILVNCVQDTGVPAQTNFESQFFRCNIDPTELYVLSLPGSTQKRLLSHDSDFDNLYLAGDWTFTDLNIGCIEAAVISAKMASRAISGKPDHIYGAFGAITPIVNTCVPKAAPTGGIPPTPHLAK
jgi:uncharacterized protein with NAD-binding domain and iron-sulfur cluster